MRRIYSVLSTLLVILAIGAGVNVYGKTLNVISCKGDQFYVGTDIPKDLNGNSCALIRIMPPDGVDITKVQPRGGVFKYENDGSVVKCYVTAGTKRVDINVPGYDPLTIILKDYGIEDLQSKQVINLKLGSGNRYQQIEDGDGKTPFVKIPWVDHQTLVFYLGSDLSDINYYEAKKICEQMNSDAKGGYTNWRLPTYNEMMFFFRDYPEYADDEHWVDYDGVIISGKSIPEVERAGSMRFMPCVTGTLLKVHQYRVNTRGKLVQGELYNRSFVPVAVIPNE